MQCQTYYLCVCRRCCNENSTEPAGGEAHIALGGPVSLRQLAGQVAAVEAIRAESSASCPSSSVESTPRQCLFISNFKE